MDKLFFVLYASAVLFQIISGQCINNAANIGVSNIGVVGNNLPSINYGCGASGFGPAATDLSLGSAGLNYESSGLNYASAGLNYGSSGLNYGSSGLNYGSANLGGSSYGGSFPVSSYSPIAPTSLSVTSENQFVGPVTVYGQLPFLTAVSLEGQVPSGGIVGVNYSCGDGNVRILSDNSAASDTSYGSLAGYESSTGYGSSLAGAGLCGSSISEYGTAAPILTAPILAAPSIAASYGSGWGAGY